MSDTIDAGKATRARQDLQAELESMQERIVVASATLINEIGAVHAETLQETVDRAVALILELRAGRAAPHEKLGDVPPVDVLKETEWPTVEAGGEREPDYWLLRRPNNEISVHRTNEAAKDEGDAYCFVEPLYLGVVPSENTLTVACDLAALVTAHRSTEGVPYELIQKVNYAAQRLERAVEPRHSCDDCPDMASLEGALRAADEQRPGPSAAAVLAVARELEDIAEPASRTEATEAPCRVDPAAVVELAGELRGIVAESGPLEVELELPHQVLHRPNDGPPRPRREINVRAVGSDWADPVKQYGPGGDFEWIRLPVRGVERDEPASPAAAPYSDETIRALTGGGFGPLLNAMHCANCGGNIDKAQADLRVEIENRNQLHGRLDEARGEAAVAKRELEESRAETAAALTDLDNVKAAMEALREQLRQERADVQPALAAVSRALAEKQAECDEASRKLGGKEKLRLLMGAVPPPLPLELAELKRWAAKVGVSFDQAGLRAGDELRERLMDAGPGLDVKVDDGGQAVPVCPVCHQHYTRVVTGSPLRHSCDCLLDGVRGRIWLNEANWWQHVAIHTGCRACHMPPALIDGLLHHDCEKTGKRWRKEPREWYARHRGAGEQATDEAP